MGIEIERKFLVRDARWQAAVESESRLIQGYLSADVRLTVRVRQRDDQAVLTLKGATRGLTRAEFEYPIPLADAQAMLAELAVGALIDKRRYLVREAGQLWEVDVFAGENHGLVLAELELHHEHQLFERPDWLGDEVSDDLRYFNANLARHPFCHWKV